MNLYNFDHSKRNTFNYKMMYSIISTNGRMAIGIFILILTANIFVCSYECPIDIHQNCNCEKTDSLFEFNCTEKTNETISMKHFKPSSVLMFNCTNVYESDGGDTIFKLLNFNASNIVVGGLEMIIYSCPMSVVTMIGIYVMSHIETSSFEIIANDLSTLPANILTNQTGLTYLGIKGDKLTTLPDNIFKRLTELDVLIVTGSIETLPDDIFDALAKLRGLELNRNQLTILPVCIFKNLVGLITLNLSENKLKSIPETIFKKQTYLRRLALNSNQLQTLPANIFEGQTWLEWLSLSDNQLHTLPANLFESQTRLKELDLTGNQLQTLNANVFEHRGQWELDMRLGENPWKCDCEFLKIVRIYEENLNGDTECIDGESVQSKLASQKSVCQF